MRLSGLLALICYLVTWTASLGHVHLDGVARCYAAGETATVAASGRHQHCCDAVHNHCHEKLTGCTGGKSSGQDGVGEESSTPAPVHHHHDGDDCQLCHHLGHAVVDVVSIELTSLDVPGLYVPELAAEIHACFVASSPAPRGPPALMSV